MAELDNEIIRAIRDNRNDKALEMLYGKIFPDIRRFIRSNSGRQEDAEDVFQDALIVLYKYIKTGKYTEGHSLQAFLQTICRNLWINKAKRDNRQVSLDKLTDVADTESITDELISVERARFVEEAMGKLGERCRELLIMSNFDKLSMKEIAAKMGFKNEDAAKTRKYKCMQSLINIMKDKKLSAQE